MLQRKRGRPRQQSTDAESDSPPVVKREPERGSGHSRFKSGRNLEDAIPAVKTERRGPGRPRIHNDAKSERNPEDLSSVVKSESRRGPGRPRHRSVDPDSEKNPEDASAIKAELAGQIPEPFHSRRLVRQGQDAGESCGNLPPNAVNGALTTACGQRSADAASASPPLKRRPGRRRGSQETHKKAKQERPEAANQQATQRGRGRPRGQVDAPRQDQVAIPSPTFQRYKPSSSTSEGAEKSDGAGRPAQASQIREPETPAMTGMELALVPSGTAAGRRRLWSKQAGQAEESPQGLAIRGAFAGEEGESRRRSVALRLQSALGLDYKATRELTQRLRELSPAELQRRMGLLQAGVPAALRRPKARPSPKQRGKTPNVQKNKGGRGRPSKVLALGAPPVQRALGMCAFQEAAAGCLLGAFLQSELELAVLACLGPPELCRLRAVASGAVKIIDTESWNRYRAFQYLPELFECLPQRSTRSGRLSLPRAGETARRLVRFLSWPRHFTIFEELDLQWAPAQALESRDFQEALRRMPQLSSVTVPWDGWSTPTERSRFVGALPRGVSYELRGPSGDLLLSGTSG